MMLTAPAEINGIGRRHSGKDPPDAAVEPGFRPERGGHDGYFYKPRFSTERFVHGSAASDWMKILRMRFGRGKTPEDPEQAAIRQARSGSFAPQVAVGALNCPIG